MRNLTIRGERVIYHNGVYSITIRQVIKDARSFKFSISDELLRRAVRERAVISVNFRELDRVESRPAIEWQGSYLFKEQVSSKFPGYPCWYRFWFWLPFKEQDTSGPELEAEAAHQLALSLGR